ncbi:MAG: OmpA family protein [Flavobacteriales bacterium]|nr:OmpA family protein [Flavobacteriales bacterium]
MRSTFLYILLFILFSSSAFAQCECEADKKYDKLLSQAEDKKKYDLRKRIAFLEDARELQEDCPRADFRLGELYFIRAKTSSNISYRQAQEYFEPLSQRCPDYHSDIHYYLGVIYYSQEDWSKSLESFDRFIDFPLDDPSKLARNYERKRSDVEGIISEVQFNAEIFGNPVPFDPVRVSGISTSSDEYLPMLSPDNERIYFTRKYTKKAKGDLYGRQVEEFTQSMRDGLESDFSRGKAMPAPFNLGDNYGGASLSVNNKEMYLTVCKPDPSGYPNCDIYVTRYAKQFNERTEEQEYTWTELENLGGGVNTKDGWEAQPSLSADGNTLYFATARESSTENAEGGKSIDIYYSLRGSDGRWGKARSIGEQINGPGNEKSPFMHGDSRTLYFASDGLPGVGGYDIFYSRLQDDGTWTEPKNMGIPINTPEDEHGLIVSTDGRLAYYSSNKIQGAEGLDVFRFEMPEAAQPDQVILVRGDVKDEDGEIVEDARIQLNYLDSKKVERVEIDPDDGSYATIINVEQEPVVMTIEKKDHAFEAKLFTEEVAEQSVIAEVDLTVQKVEVGKPYTINDIYYRSNSADIDENSKLVLNQFADYLARNPSLHISIHGHTDNIGSDADNLTLSTERAFEVMTYLQELGIPGSSLSFKGFGASRPIADNATAEGRAKNRRTEFIIEAK